MASGRDVFLTIMEFWLLVMMALGAYALAPMYEGMMRSFAVLVGSFLGVYAILSLVGRTLLWIGIRAFDFGLEDIWRYVVLLLGILAIAALIL